jgi:hypothetical protein
LIPSVTAAIWCGAIPLAVGTATFVLWLVTSAMALQMLGLLTIFAGLILVAGGGILWLMHLIATLRAPQSATRRRQLMLSCVALVVLLANFPTCIFIVAAVTHIESAFTVEIANTGVAPVNGASVSYYGATHPLGPIAPGATVTKTLYAEGGPLAVSITRADGSVQSTELASHLDADDVRTGRTYRAVITNAGIESWH